MNGPDGPEEREAERLEAADRADERQYWAEQRADELHDALIDIMTPVSL